MSLGSILVGIIALVGVILAGVFMYLYFTKKCEPPNCPQCPQCPTGGTGCIGCTACPTGAPLGWPYPSIPDAPRGMTVGLPGVDFPSQGVNSGGNYGLLVLDNNANIMIANSGDQNAAGWGQYSKWQVLNYLPSQYSLSMSYVYDNSDDDWSELSFFEGLTGGGATASTINWLTAQPGIALPMYSDMAIGVFIDGPNGSESSWMGAPGASDSVTIVIEPSSKITMYTDYGGDRLPS